MLSTEEIFNMSLDILKNTNDGDDLSPADLRLVENAVNGFLNDRGIQAFMEIHEKVMNYSYMPSWFHGIEHLTIDHRGFLVWKNNVVDQFTIPWAFTCKGKEKALEIEKRCKAVEARGMIPDIGNIIWDWEDTE